MPAEYGERTEAPTLRRRQEARERGQVARSTDLTSTAVLVSGLLALKLFGGALCNVMLAIMAALLSPAELTSATAIPELRRLCWQLLLTLGAATAPVLLAMAGLALAANLVQVGPLLTGHPIAPQWSKISPAAGLRRLFSMQSSVQLIAGVLKLLIVASIAHHTIAADMPRLAGIQELEAREVMAVAAQMTWTLGIRLGVALLLLAGLDYGYRRWQHERDLRMTREEVKEELKRMEGDPLMKHRRRQMQLQIALQRLRRDVPKSDVIVTNPTELAIALRYDGRTMSAPTVTAKGAGVLARRIRELAAEHGIPIVERKPLAQALYKMVDVGQQIPSEFYRAVAEILAYVYELTGRARRRSA